MLDCKMTSLSPATPLNFEFPCYGWENDPLNSGIGMKIDPTDIMELIEPSSSASSNSNYTTGFISQLQHPISDREYHFQNTTYLTNLSSISTEPYSPGDCHIPDHFQPAENVDSPFNKTSDQSHLSETYGDNFFSDLIHPPNNHIPNHAIHNHTYISTHPENQGHHNMHSGSISSNCYYSINDMNSGIPHYHEFGLEDFCDPTVDFNLLRKGESPSSSESISYTDNDSEMDSKSSRESISTLTDIRNPPPKRRVGRPPKKDKKLKRASEKKTGRLWEFIRDLLKNPEYCPSLVRWENPEEGHFRFVNSEKVAQLWGQIKGNPRMTYEKLSRAMRYYYKSHVFEPVLGRRLVYKFGYNAVNWKPLNPNFQKYYN